MPKPPKPTASKSEESSPDLSALLAVTATLNRINEDHADDPSYHPPVPADLPEPVTKWPTPGAPFDEPLPATPATSKPDWVPVTQALDGRRLVFTGSLCVGKDHVATALGASVLGFADPIYALVPLFFGRPCNKSDPGVREFLQRVGQWGRGEVNEQYPLTVERALFCEWARGLPVRPGIRMTSPEEGRILDSVAWRDFGTNADLWIDAALARAQRPDKRRVAITNARFPNELKRLRDTEKWEHWHVMCSPKTWAERLAKQGLTPSDPRVNDFSEKMAAQLNRAMLNPSRGPKLRVVWNDNTPPPNDRFFTLPEFVARYNQP